MTETGWPLIPREVLPAPVPVARSARRRPAAPSGRGRQLAIFGADTTDASPADLAGLLAGPGRLGRMGGTARVSVRVDAAWRVHVLVAELVIRGLAASWTPVVEPDGVSFEVRTAYSSRLNGLARAWPPAAGALYLSGPRLRLWVAAAGRAQPGGYGLGLDPERTDVGKDHEVIDAALVRAGLAGTVSDGGLCYVISGRRRLRRLAELVGDRPEAAPDGLWPGGATA